MREQVRFCGIHPTPLLAHAQFRVDRCYGDVTAFPPANRGMAEGPSV